MTSSFSYLFLLILIFILVTCGCWSELHHKKVKNVNLAARRKIDLLVKNNWDQLLEKAKRVLDCRLADGKELEQFSNIVLLTGRFDFSSETEEAEEILFNEVNNIVKQRERQLRIAIETQCSHSLSRRPQDLPTPPVEEEGDEQLL